MYCIVPLETIKAMSLRTVFLSSVTSAVSTIFNWLAVVFLPDSTLANPNNNKSSNMNYYNATHEGYYDWSSIENEEAVDEIGKHAISERNTDVLYKIARLYYQGFGSVIVANPYKAVEYFTQAADYGEVRSMYYLGIIYAGRGETRGEIPIGIDVEKAIKYLEKAINRGGHVDAMFELGYLYAYGINKSYGIKDNDFHTDIKKSISYFEQAEECGHIDSLYELGRIYENGYKDENMILPADMNKAMYYYQLAVDDGGHAEAISKLNNLEELKKCSK